MWWNYWTARWSEHVTGSTFAEQVAGSIRSDDHGVKRVGGDIEAIAGMIKVRYPMHRDGNFALQDNIRGGKRIGVVGIVFAGRVFSNVRAGIALAAKLRC